MVYEVVKNEFGDKFSYRLTNTTTDEYCEILPFLGGAINSLYLQVDHGKNFNLINGYDSLDEIRSSHHKIFKGANLFPFPNRIASGKYIFGGFIFNLEKNFIAEGNAIHGLVYDREFEVEKMTKGDDCCSISLRYSPAEFVRGYPFLYTLSVEYRFSSENGLTVQTEVYNRSDCVMPFGHGWHPYFNGLNFNIDQLFLEMQVNRIFDTDDAMIPTGNFQLYDSFLLLKQIGDTSFDDCFEFKSEELTTRVVLSDPVLRRNIIVWSGDGGNKYKYMQVYTPADRKSLAIEPMTCLPNSFNNGVGLELLEPKQSRSFTWGVRLEEGSG